MVPGRGREKGACSPARSYAPRLRGVPQTRPEERTVLPSDLRSEISLLSRKSVEMGAAKPLRGRRADAISCRLIVGEATKALGQRACASLACVFLVAV